MSPSHRTALACAAAVILLVPGMAAAQTCLISGPSNFCGASTQLCGPVGAAEYQWTGPGIVGATNGQCVTVSAPGTYSLRLFDADNGLWSAPCTRTLSQTGGPLASIDGPGSVCGSQTITLCGPSGSFSYAWSGPGGFQSSASCLPKSRVPSEWRVSSAVPRANSAFPRARPR